MSSFRTLPVSDQTKRVGPCSVSRPWSKPPRSQAPPDFANLLAVLACQRPSRPTLADFWWNGRIQQCFLDQASDLPPFIQARRNAGYDFAPLRLPNFLFESERVEEKASLSLNEGAVIADRASFDVYAWPNPTAADTSVLDDLGALLPEGMKLVLHGPGGVQEGNRVTGGIGF